jgi:hypothetical protein
MVWLWWAVIPSAFLLRWLYRVGVEREWWFPLDRAPQSTAMGAAALSVQSILEPSKRHVLVQKTGRRRRESAQGEPRETSRRE